MDEPVEKHLYRLILSMQYINPHSFLLREGKNIMIKYRFLIILLGVSIVISACQMRYEDRDDLIWKGYSLVRASEEMPGEGDKAQYLYEYSDLSATVINDPTNSSACLPSSLRQVDHPVRGESFLARVLMKTNREEVAVLDFTRWEGSSVWWVQEVGRSECYLLEDTR